MMFDRFKAYLANIKTQQELQAKLDKQAACPHLDVDRRLVIDSVTYPGRREVVCLACGLIKVFDNKSN